MPQVRIRDGGGTLRTLQRIRMRDGEGTLRMIQRIRVRDATNVLRTVWQYLVATLSTNVISATAATSTITTASVTCNVTGGTAPYTYQWVPSGDYFDGVSATTPTAAATTFRRTTTTSGDAYLGSFTCNVTDATGFTTTSDAVAVEITRT